MSTFSCVISVAPLTSEQYAPYGQVIQADTKEGSALSANQGTALKFPFVSKVVNKRKNAIPNLSVFRCSPHNRNQDDKPLKFSIKLLERHEFSTQQFIPMGSEDARYLVIVAKGGDKPDLSTMKAFLATGKQGVSYSEGIWHHPMIALDKQV